MTLLVGYVPGKSERTAIDLAAVLARTADQDLLVVTVVPGVWPTPVAGADGEFGEAAAESGERAVAEVRAILEEACPDLRADATWTSGRSIPSALATKAEEIEASLIVVGAGHTGPYGHVSLSSTADWLLHSSRIPVAVATRGYRGGAKDRLGRVTVAFRGDEVSHSVLERAARISAELGAELRVVTFAIRGRTMYPKEISGAEEMVLQGWLEQAGAAQADAVAALAEHGVDTAQVRTDTGIGRDWPSAIESVEWRTDEVLVIGSSSGAGLISRLFLGANAAKIIRHSPVPVIAVH